MHIKNNYPKTNFTKTTTSSCFNLLSIFSSPSTMGTVFVQSLQPSRSVFLFRHPGSVPISYSRIYLRICNAHLPAAVFHTIPFQKQPTRFISPIYRYPITVPSTATRISAAAAVTITSLKLSRTMFFRLYKPFRKEPCHGHE